MNLTLTIDNSLAERLRVFAAARGISVDEAGRQVLLAGLKQATLPQMQSTMLELGPLHASPPSAEQIGRMRSPIIACGPIPPGQITIVDPQQSEKISNAH